MRVLVLGAGGLLGTALQSVLGGQVVATAGRGRLDVRDPAGIQAVVADADADLVVNCAAHTDVDGAERAPDVAFAANAVLPGLVAGACRRAGATLLHISSTGCYGDGKATPYTEEDEPRPTTVHHRSKLSGERAVRESGCEFLILRTGWLFGGSAGQPKNFVWRRLLEARGAETLLSDPHQHGNPTFATDVARQCLPLMALGIRGTFNCVSGPGASRLDYVGEIVHASGLACRVEPSTTPFARAAAVSANEMAVNYRLGLLGQDAMPPWRDALRRYVAQLLRSPEWAAQPGDEGRSQGRLQGHSS